MYEQLKTRVVVLQLQSSYKYSKFLVASVE